MKESVKYKVKDRYIRLTKKKKKNPRKNPPKKPKKKQTQRKQYHFNTKYSSPRNI